MRKIYPVLLLLSFLACTLCKGQGTPVYTFGTNPGNLNCYKYVPAGMPANAPLVVVLHGCSQTALSYSLETAWDTLANAHKFYVVYAEQNLFNNSGNCFNYFEASDCSRNQGEAFSIKQMTDYMKTNYSIDSSRVFVTGLSAGGAMTAVMLSVYPDVFNAGAIMAGLPYNPLTALDSVEYAMLGDISHTPQQWGDIVRNAYPNYSGNYPRLSVFQGTADAVVNIENAHELVKQFTNLHGCDTVPDYTTAAFNGNNLIRLQQYSDSNNRVAVQLYQISNMAHGIAVYPGNCYQQGGATDEFAYNENFYSSFWAAQFFGILHLPFSIQGYDTVNVYQQGITYAVPNVSGATYQWLVPAGVTIVSGQGTNSITVNWNNVNGIISISETPANNCVTGPAEIFVTVKASQLSTDAALSNLNDPGIHVCADTVSPVFTLNNVGQTTLTSVALHYSLDNGVLENYYWTGSLSAANSLQITLPVLNVSAGNHILLIYCDTINNSLDGNLNNDTLKVSFTSGIAPIVTLHLTPDTTCTNNGMITLTGGNPVGGIYTGANVANNSFDAISAGTGSFAINYTYTDSIGCYNTTTENILVEACASVTEMNEDNSIHIFPNPTPNGQLQIISNAALLNKTASIFDATGRLMMKQKIISSPESLNVSQLNAGIYLIRIDSYVQKLVIE